MLYSPPTIPVARLARGSWILLALATVGLGRPHAAAAQPPPGQSARLFGVHDLTSSSIAYLDGATASCDKGWITHLTYLESDAATVSPPAGISLITRLDWNYSESAPTDGGLRNAYVDRFVESVRRSPDVHVWIVGNEPNFTASGPWPGDEVAYITPYIEPFVDAYARIRPAVHAVGGHEQDAVLLPAPSPWSPCFLEGFARIIRGINARGVPIDGFAIHPGTRHPNDSQRADRVTAADGFHSCSVTPYTDGSGQFGVFRDFIRVIDAEGHSGAPIYVTESAHNTDTGGVVNHVDEDRGFLTAIYDEVDAWNRANGHRIRAVTPYRWTTFGDGSGRDHSIEGKSALQADHRRRVDLTWTAVDCTGSSPSGCNRDGECAPTQVCDLATRECAGRSPCPCGPSETCRSDANVCVPTNRGPATIRFEPAAPEPGQTVRIDVFATTGYTNIGLTWEGPLPGGAPELTFVGIQSGDGGFHWIYDAQLPTWGTYRATFVADPLASTVYGIAYLAVEQNPPPQPTDAGNVGGFDAGFGSADTGSVGGVDAGPGSHGGGETGLMGSCTMVPAPAPRFPVVLSLVLLTWIRRRRGRD